MSLTFLSWSRCLLFSSSTTDTRWRDRKQGQQYCGGEILRAWYMISFQFIFRFSSYDCFFSRRRRICHWVYCKINSNSIEKKRICHACAYKDKFNWIYLASNKRNLLFQFCSFSRVNAKIDFAHSFYCFSVEKQSRRVAKICFVSVFGISSLFDGFRKIETR